MLGFGARKFSDASYSVSHLPATSYKTYVQCIHFCIPVATSQSNHTRTTALSNSMKLSHARGATQDGRVMMERFDRMWSTGEGNGKPLQYSCLENPMNSMKRQNDRILKWFAIPFSSGPLSVKSLHHDPPVLGCPTGMA